MKYEITLFSYLKSIIMGAGEINAAGQSDRVKL